LSEKYLQGLPAYVRKGHHAQAILSLFRDLKPENIMIQGDKLKVTDFGFAKALSSSRQLTSTVIGTPLYMSPQILSKQSYSSKCDIWSIGIIFY
jgi:serine/threonine protein kinase